MRWRKLAQARVVQAVAQFRLAEQDDLQQLAVVRFDVGEQPDLFEQVVGQILRLVNDEHAIPAVLDLVQQKFVDESRGFPAGRGPSPPGRIRSAMAFINSSALITGFRISAVEKRLVELFQQRAAQRRLARADFAGELDKALALADAVKQMIDRLAVLSCCETESAGSA